MTRDEAILLILNRTGQRGGTSSPLDTQLQAQAITEMKFVQEELERGEKSDLPWFLETEHTDAGFKTTIGSGSVAIPTGFLRELDDETVTLYYQDSEGDWQPLDKVDYDEGHHQYGASDDGTPKAYTLLGEIYRVWPAADAEYLLKALIYKADASLATNIENKWLKYAGKLIIGRTGEVVAGQLVRDAAMRDVFADMATEGAAALTRDNRARKEAGRMRQMGED